MPKQSTRWTRGAVTLAVVVILALAAGGCGGSNAAGDGAAGSGPGGGAGGAGAGGAGGSDAGPADGPPDLATDFGLPMTSDVAIDCPKGGGQAAADAALLIDDFSGMGVLDGRSRVAAGFEIKDQFDATANARFDPEPAVEPKCGAAAAGAAHFRGKAAATFAVIFSSAGDGGKPNDHYDASATKGLTFRVALGNAKAAQLLTVRVNLAGSNNFDYTKDVIVNGTTWQEVTIAWTELQAAAAAPKFSAATLNQIVLPFAAGDDVDLYVDDLAFVP
jgi:hypothetical protein